MPSTLSMVETAPARAGQAAFAPSINDLAIRVGTVNGSGSQSANLVILRALYAMGIPCSGKNVFPSNIEGLPTWFHIRASAKGYVGHVLDPQVLVCMHEPTAKDDVTQLKPGALCFYREDFDEAFQVMDKAVMLGYQSKPEGRHGEPQFVIIRFPQELADALRFEPVGQEK